MILAIMIMVLIAGGLLSWLTGRSYPSGAKSIALIATLTDLALMIYVWQSAAPGSNTWIMDFQRTWIPSFGISFHLAMDGLSALLVLLTFFLGVLAVLCSWKEVRERTGFYYFNLLWTLAGICGVFVAMDLFLFYFFWEVMLVPMYLLIVIWGDSNRQYAAYKFFIFTQAGGLLMLISILALYFIHGSQTGVYSYDYFSLLGTRIQGAGARWIMLGFMAAFMVKLPAVPFHNWLPDAHSEAPTAGSLILAGLLLKTGAYGIIRFVLQLFPRASAEMSQWAILIGVIGIVYGAMLAFAQTDIKRLIAYTSVSHMGFVLVGIFAFTELAMQGVVLQLITHGISTGALFVMAGMIKERLHTREMERMGGLWTLMPRMGSVALLFTMASLGLPAFGNFIAEFLILLGAFPVSTTLVVIATLGFVLSALYSLRFMQKIFLGPVVTDQPLRDLSTREKVIMVSLSLVIVALGLFPQAVIDMTKTVVTNVTGT